MTSRTAALECIAKGGRFNAVLLHVMMPDVTGMEMDVTERVDAEIVGDAWVGTYRAPDGRRVRTAKVGCTAHPR